MAPPRVASFDAAVEGAARRVRPVRERARQDRRGDEVRTGAATVRTLDRDGASRGAVLSFGAAVGLVVDAELERRAGAR